MVSAADRPLKSVLQDIVGNVQDIVRFEIRLATVEARREFGKAAKAGKLTALGGTLALFSLAFFLLSAVFALALILPLWMASLSVAVVLGAVGAQLISQGTKKFKRVHSLPVKTIESIRETLHG